MKKLISIGFIAAIALFGYNIDSFSSDNDDLAIERGCRAVLLENGETVYIGIGCKPIVRY